MVKLMKYIVYFAAESDILLTRCLLIFVTVVVTVEALLRASAHNYGPNNGTSRKIDFAHILPIDCP